MNPFTDTLVKRLKDRQIVQFVAHWDALEDLVIRVYKSKEVTADDAARFRRAKAWLSKNYRRWKPALKMYWLDTRIAGEPAGEDPFESMIAFEDAAEFAGNWRAMQTLPAAREALNAWLVDLIEEEARRS